MNGSDGQDARAAAVALRYDPEHGREAAPRVVAKGYGVVADAIIARARRRASMCTTRRRCSTC